MLIQLKMNPVKKKARENTLAIGDLKVNCKLNAKLLSNFIVGSKGENY
jgi:hypothetical protein